MANPKGVPRKRNRPPVDDEDALLWERHTKLPDDSSAKAGRTTKESAGRICKHSMGQSLDYCVECNTDDSGNVRTPAKVQPAKDNSEGAKSPRPATPATPWAQKIPPIQGVTWHSKLFPHMDAYGRIAVIMAQLAELEREMRVKAGTWDGTWEFYASRKYVSLHAHCSKMTVYRVWLQLIADGVLSRKPGTGRQGVTSEWIFYGAGFPKRKPKVGGQ